jgi:hypothetical protein
MRRGEVDASTEFLDYSRPMSSLRGYRSAQLAATDSPRARAMFPSRDAQTFLSATAIAENYWNLHARDRSTWSHEIDLRPSVEKFVTPRGIPS